MSNTTQNTLHTHHKEEAKGRIKADQEDRLSLRNTLDVYINSFDNESYPDGALMNIMIGQIAHPDVKADNALALGQQATKDFKSGWPGTFYDPLGKLIVPMDVKKACMCQLVRSVSMIKNFCTCYCSTCQFTWHKLRWCLGMWVSCISSIDVQSRRRNGNLKAKIYLETKTPSDCIRTQLPCPKHLNIWYISTTLDHQLATWQTSCVCWCL